MAGIVFQGAESFLGHSGSAGGGGFLKNWKDDGEIDVVLHPQSNIAALWAHRWHRIDKDKEDKLKIFPMRFNSMEKEMVLKRQHFRKDDGTRELPPVICPFSLLLEWVREQIEDGHIDWTDDIFKFDVPREEVIVQAGGFCGLFQKNNLSDEQLEELKRAKVNRKEAFKQNGGCKLSYVFVVVQYAIPEEGAMIAMEGKALGKAMQKAMRDEERKWQRTKTPDKGNPFKEPFVFRWTYDDKLQFDDAYDVVAMPNESMPITNDLKLQFDEPPPSIDNLIEPSNVALLRLSFEEHWCHRITPPWAQLFAVAEAAVKGTPAAELPTDFNHGANAKTDAGHDGHENDDEIECDVCHKGMNEKDTVCPHCGAVLDVSLNRMVAKPEPPKEETKRRTRGEAKSGTAADPGVDASKPKRRS